MLSVNHVTKKYGRFTALRDITLEFQNGVYGLLAPNGAGKTTLMKMLSTLYFPTKGEITWNGSNIVDLDENYRSLIGYLPQKFGYYKNDTPRQFLRYMAKLKGLDRSYADERIQMLLEKVFLSDVIDQKMKKFSGGMLQRVGIAQALLNDPEILILDEPTAGLDPKERVRFRNMLRDLSHDRIVILSTHIVSDIETIADKIILLKDREVFCCETPEKICERLRGKIYELPVGSAISGNYEILYERQSPQGTKIRFYSEEPDGNAAEVPPTLEDVFLTIYRDER
ncbi:MAG: ABC transporter ATP-binding protein [Candidatus Gastranaerophilales bacterium]|nr:ABC transporter ATP-binding protein [Candidatus Gastranaerophilales bacterium]